MKWVPQGALPANSLAFGFLFVQVHRHDKLRDKYGIMDIQKFLEEENILELYILVCIVGGKFYVIHFKNLKT